VLASSKSRSISANPRARLVALIVVGLIVSACGSSQVGPANGQASFLAHAKNAVFFVQWDRNNAALTGSLELTLLGTPAGSQVQTQNTPFTGTISGDGLTLKVTPTSGSAATYVGTVGKTGFSLTYPGAQNGQLITLAFAPSSVAAYDLVATVLTNSQYPRPCNLSLQGEDAEVLISGASAPSQCAAFVAAMPSDQTWTTAAQQQPADITAVCDLVSGEDTATVEDDGGQVYGTQACDLLRNQGWTTRSLTGAFTTTSKCGTLKGPEGSYAISAGTGIGCATARQVFTDLWVGNGVVHQGIDEANSYTAVDGWGCGSGAGGFGCSYGTQYISADTRL
jgi:hypothetical protein